MILASGLDADAAQAAALEELCCIYWRPVFACLCRRGQAPATRRASPRIFFVRVLTGSLLGGADPAKGRFRSYLLTALEHFCSDARDRARARKRGGDRQFISLSEFRDEARGQAALEPWPGSSRRTFRSGWPRGGGP